MIVGVPKEIVPGERRVALVPDAVRALVKLGLEVVVEAGAGVEAGCEDAAFEEAGARISADAASVWGSDLVLKVQPPTEAAAGHEVDRLRSGAALICFLRPLDQTDVTERLASRGVNAFSMEMMPRITRAQSMDALSSQSTISGYQAVLLAAVAQPRIFPMLVTAAGTLKPARALVVGVGVAGLQALGTAKRLGAITYGYDTRAVVKEQVESLGARFVELDLDTGDSEDAGGYAKAQTEEFYQRQRRELGKHVAQADVVITTALVPGQKAPLLIEEDAVKQMKPGSVIVDLAAEKGGNCALTKANEDIVVHGVTIIGHTNLPSEKPAHASQMYAKNLVTFIEHLVDEGQLVLDWSDEITAGTIVTHGGKIVSERLGGTLPVSEPSAEDSAEGES
ncbi:MAG: Re/Si-specific NAD(P)(+) transhydrogenase subunit alpha [Deltaproteobacteria bacterium]|nr:Re/Si-specific NAD(P)(+) transhydrogenase subunit alpha [Deltaproteobacteria bacterium]MBW2384435.1 Re/Si-specific NAD(P)(+) transhydrogenase subunit alpha [Deltaproteobacteria bacterium]MBW2695251.1 Re/Si-specific NAD(P)(+) transhydrogenase subunit alpha [Deltaproteobacteria bacterium]